MTGTGARFGEGAMGRQGSGSAGGASRIQVQTYPLAASRRTLQQFCDRWFNDLVPAEVAYFKPAVPAVMCSVLHYPDMGGAVTWRTGVTSQNEVYFLMVLERYRRVRGRLQFVEYGVTTPYIFVDNAESALEGRESFGFPKQGCRFDAPTSGAPQWSPYATRLLSVSAWEPSTTGQRLHPLLQIVQQAGGGRAPVDTGAGELLRPRSQTPSGMDLVWLLRTLFDEARARATPASLLDAGRVAEQLWAAVRDMEVSVFNLRQFAHPTYKHRALYQDLIKFTMRVAAVQALRSFEADLGAQQFSLLVHRSDIRPIVQRLGLRVFDVHRAGEVTTDVLNAYLPMYGQADVELVGAERLCWRYDQGGHDRWYDHQGRAITGGQEPAAPVPYNDYLGPSAAAFLEDQPDNPIRDIKILMLPARADAVDAALATMVPSGAPIAVRCVATEGYTALRLYLSRSRPRPEDEQEELVWLDGCYASMSVPVTWSDGVRNEQALMILRDFTDNGFLLQSLRELSPGPTVHGAFTSHRSDWLSYEPDVVRLVRLDATTLERSADAARMTVGPVLDVLSSREATIALPDHGTVEALWPMLRRSQPMLTVGVIPDPEREGEVVSRRLVLTEATEHDELPTVPFAANGLYVQFHDSEIYPLVRQLGLETLPNELPLVQRMRRGVVGRTGLVPVAAWAQMGLRLRASRRVVLWDSYEEPRRR